MHTTFNSQHRKTVDFLKNSLVYSVFTDHNCYIHDVGKTLLRNNLEIKVYTENIKGATRDDLIQYLVLLMNESLFDMFLRACKEILQPSSMTLNRSLLQLLESVS